MKGNLNEEGKHSLVVAASSCLVSERSHCRAGVMLKCWVKSSEQLLLQLTRCQAAAAYRLLSKASWRHLHTPVRGLLLCVISASGTCATWESQIISLWITCPRCITGGRQLPCKHTHLSVYWQLLPPEILLLFLQEQSWKVDCGRRIWGDGVRLRKERKERSHTASRWSGISENSSSYVSTFFNLSANYSAAESPAEAE